MDLRNRGEGREQDKTRAATASFTPVEAPPDLTQQTDIAWINDLMQTGIAPELRKKYIHTRTNPWMAGLLFDPENKLAQKYHLDRAAASTGPKLSNDQVTARLTQAAAKGWPLEIEAHLRGVDGPGSSQDLLRFQVKLTNPDKAFTWMFDMPATTAIASEFTTRIRVEAADAGEEDKIVYVAPDYFDGPHKRKISDPEDLRNAHGLVSMRDLPAYSLAHYFGIKQGIKITCEGLSPLPKEGGMESSNAFSTSVYAIGSMLSQANWSWAKIIKHAVYDENTLYGEEEPGITGGQGHASSCLGGENTLIWCSGFGSAGIEDDEQYIYTNDTYAILAVPLLISPRSRFNERLFLCQPGKAFEPGGKPVKGRLASDTNFEWTEEWSDPVGQRLHFMKKELHYIWKRAAEEGDDQAASYALNQYSKIRLALNERYKQWYRATTGTDASGGVGYMDEYSKPLFEKIAAAGGGFMPAGAGGIGSVCIAYLPEDVKADHFFQQNGMALFDAAQAEKVKENGGTLKGYLPFKSSDEPLQLSSGWEQIGVKQPACPPVVVVNQASGEVLSAEAFFKGPGANTVTLPGDVDDRLTAAGRSLPEAKALARDINRALQRTDPQ